MAAITAAKSTITMCWTNPPSRALYCKMAHSPGHRERDVRVDFFRGLALVFIFIDHIPENGLMAFTLQNFGFSDAADVFVGLAGYASFLAYTREFDGQGWTAGLAKVGRRIRELYLAHIAVLIVCVGALALAGERSDNPVYDDLVDLSPFMDNPGTAFRKALILVHQPSRLDILPLYIILLAWFPILLWLLRIHVALAFAVSAMLWMGANVLGWNLPRYWDDSGWFFNPFAWQLLFSLGAITAYLTTRGKFPSLPSWLLWAAMGFVLFAFVMVAPWTLLPGLEHARLLPDDFLRSEDNKQSLSLWRVAHIAALAFIAASVIPARASWLSQPWAQRVAECGRHSLPVFCLGIILSFAGTVAMAEFGSGWAMQISVNAIGIALLVLTGWTLAELQRAKASSLPVEDLAMQGGGSRKE